MEFAPPVMKIPISRIVDKTKGQIRIPPAVISLTPSLQPKHAVVDSESSVHRKIHAVADRFDRARETSESIGHLALFQLDDTRR
jgi:hypothetical protein